MHYCSVNLVFVSCKNRIFPKNPVFLYSSTHKIKVDRILLIKCELSVKNFRMNKNRLSYIHTGFDSFLKVVKSYRNLTLNSHHKHKFNTPLHFGWLNDRIPSQEAGLLSSLIPLLRGDKKGVCFVLWSGKQTHPCPLRRGFLKNLTARLSGGEQQIFS